MADHTTSRFHYEWGRIIYFIDNTAIFKLLMTFLIWLPPTIIITALGYGHILDGVLAFNADTWYYVWTFATHTFYHKSMIEFAVVVGLLYLLYPFETLIGENRFHIFVLLGFLSSSIFSLIGYTLTGSFVTTSGGLPIIICLLSGFAGVLPKERIKLVGVPLPFFIIPILIIGLNIGIISLYGNGLFGQSQFSYIGSAVAGMIYGLYLSKEDLQFDEEYLPEDVSWDIDE